MHLETKRHPCISIEQTNNKSIDPHSEFLAPGSINLEFFYAQQAYFPESMGSLTDRRSDRKVGIAQANKIVVIPIQKYYEKFLGRVLEIPGFVRGTETRITSHFKACGISPLKPQ